MKRWISLTLSTALAVSLLCPFGTAVHAEELVQEDVAATAETAQAAEEDESEALKAVVAQFEALPDAADVPAMEQEEVYAAAEAVAAALDAVDALPAEEQAIFYQKYSALFAAVNEDLSEALALALNGDDQPSTMSLRPMEEHTGLTLTLSSYSRAQYQTFSVDELMRLLKDSNGDPYFVDTEGKTTVWFSFGDNMREEMHTLGNNETVNLWYYGKDYYGEIYESTNYSVSQSVIMVVGNGDQMDDAGNVRYVFQENLTTDDDVSSVSNYLSLYRIAQDGQYENADEIQKFIGGSKRTDDFEGLKIWGDEVTYAVDKTAGEEYALEWDFSIDVSQMARRGYTTTIYETEDYKTNGANAQKVAVKDENSTESFYMLPLAGERGSWVVVISDSQGQVVGSCGIAVNVVAKTAADEVSGLLYTAEGKKVTENPTKSSRNNVTFSYNFDYTKENIVNYCNTTRPNSFGLSNRGQEDKVYYLCLEPGDAIKGVYTNADDSRSGSFYSVGEAEKFGKKLSAELIPGTESDPVYGYRFDLTTDEYQSITMVMNDDSLHWAYVYWYSNSVIENNDTDLTIWNVINRKDGFSYLNTKVMYSVAGAELDSYYSGKNSEVDGYILAMIQAQDFTTEDLKQCALSFYTRSNAKVYSNGEIKSNETTLEKALWSDMDGDGVQETVQLTVRAEEDKTTQNYMVSFVVNQSEESLYVAGPAERLVNLSIANDYRHDILVANAGQEDLTITGVELKDAQNVAIDPYWTIAGGSVIPGFTTTSTSYTYMDENGEEQTKHNDYSTLANVAKVRLIAAGSGTISGTLVITASNGDKREIKLTGTAALPGFTTDQISEGVKYVPYAFMVATDNMYKWNTTTFSLVSGTLPEGLILKSTGEIYGVPQEAGTFTFTVKVTHSSDIFKNYPTEQSFTLTINDNTDANVYMATDENYEIKQAIGVEQTQGAYDFYLADASSDQLFSSYADYYVYPQMPKYGTNFMDLWLNGEKLVEDVDYTVEQGSTVITIRSQTFANKANRSGANTIAMEFRVDGDEENDLKRTAQNFYMDKNTLVESSNGSNGGSSSGGSSNAGADGAGSAAANAAAGAASQSGSINLVAQVVDVDGSVMPGVTVVLHSTPRSAVTNAGGKVSFDNVEYGQHNIAVVKDGVTIATSDFTIEKATKASAKNNVVYGPDGGTVTIVARVTAAGSVVIGGSAGTAVPQTGDDFPMTLWIVLAAMGLCGVIVCSRKRFTEK